MLKLEGVRPADLYLKALAGWRTILTVAIFSSVVGIVTSSILQPVYRASTLLQISIDYSRVAPMDDYVSAKAFQLVRGLFMSDDTMRKALVLDQQRQKGEPTFLSIMDARRSIRIGQRSDGWELVVHARDARDAAAFANAWAEVILQEMAEATAHAIQVGKAQNLLFSAYCALGPDANRAELAIWYCAVESPEEVPSSIAMDLLSQVELTRGILPIFNYSILQMAEPPDAPILWSRASTILASSVLGLCLGFLWVIGRPQ